MVLPTMLDITNMSIPTYISGQWTVGRLVGESATPAIFAVYMVVSSHPVRLSRPQEYATFVVVSTLGFAHW
jgi:hypothetical protein